MVSGIGEVADNHKMQKNISRDPYNPYNFWVFFPIVGFWRTFSAVVGWELPKLFSLWYAKFLQRYRQLINEHT